MKYLYLLATLTFLTPLFSSAQNNYKPGYVVTLKGDTLKGYVNFKEWIQNPRDFYFKTEENANSVTYSVKNCGAFGIDGFEYYRGYTTSISQDNVQLSSLTVGPNKKTLVETVFLEIVTTGKNLTLFMYNDGIKRRYFVAENGAIAVELIHSLYLDPEETSRIITQNTYVRQLQQFAAKYQPQDDKLIKEIENIAYGEKDIQQIIYKINGSENASAIHSANRPGSRFFVGAAINYTQSSFTPGTASCAYPQFSIGTDIFINKNVGDLLVRLELGYTGSKSKISFNGEDANSETTSTVKYSKSGAFLNAQVLYNFYNTNSTKIYVGLGGQLNSAIYSSRSYVTSYTLSSGSTDASDNDFPALAQFYLNITSRFGVVISNRFEIYVEYNPSTAINNAEGYSVSETSYKAGVNYLFGSK